MYGCATFRGHVLKREEKGLLGIPFKRWLLSGLGAGLLMVVLRLFLPDVALFASGLTFVALLVYLSPRGGISRYQRALLDWRWSLRVAALQLPESFLGSLGRALGIDLRSLDLDGDEIFKAKASIAPRTALTDWVSFRDPAEVEGLRFVPLPVVE